MRNRQTERQTDRQIYRQTDTGREREIHRQTDRLRFTTVITEALRF